MNKQQEIKLRKLIRKQLIENLDEDWRTEKNKWSSKEAKTIMDDSLRQWSKQLKQVKYKVVKDWMRFAKSGVMDFFDIFCFLFLSSRLFSVISSLYLL